MEIAAIVKLIEKEKTLKLYNEHLVDINIRIAEARGKIRSKIRSELSKSKEYKPEQYEDEVFFLARMLQNRGNIEKAILNLEKLPVEVWKETEVKYLYI